MPRNKKDPSTTSAQPQRGVASSSNRGSKTAGSDRATNTAESSGSAQGQSGRSALMGASAENGSAGEETTSPRESAYNRATPKSSETSSAKPTLSTELPSVNIPKGGGALRSIGETFEQNPFTGTASLSIPVATSAAPSGGRSLVPELSIGYDSGSGQSPFGLGFSLNVPRITRKTDKSVPRYIDVGPDSDTFVLSGSEDLVPYLMQEGPVGSETWVHDVRLETENAVEYVVTRYRPRVEGSFARIERWREKTSSRSHWRSWTADNIRSVFGYRDESRITDPNDPSGRRVYAWLLEERRDDRGNVIQFHYKQEDLKGVDTNSPEEYERLRYASGAPNLNQAQRYLKRISYGNRNPITDATPKDGPVVALNPDDYLFELVLDYGEHSSDPLSAYAESQSWSHRPDPFSNFKVGFDLRTRRLCKRVLMFHRFDESGSLSVPWLIRSTDLQHNQDPAGVKLEAATQHAYLPDGTSDSLPALTLDYTTGDWAPQLYRLEEQTKVCDISPGRGQLIDLDGDGLPGVLMEDAGTFYYQKPLAPAVTEQGLRPRYRPLKALRDKPNLPGLNQGSRLMDLDGSGQKSLVMLQGSTRGAFRRDGEGLLRDDGLPSWHQFKPFAGVPPHNPKDPRVHLMDLNGDGLADMLVDRGDQFWWYPSKGADGFDAARTLFKPKDEAQGPKLIYGDPKTAILTADMTGDGLPDFVRIQNGRVVYWPNLGNGNFARQVQLAGVAQFDDAHNFRADRIHLADLDGTGPTDVVYLHRKGPVLYKNLSGNALSSGHKIHGFPPHTTGGETAVEFLDLLGNGTTSLVWRSNLLAYRHQGPQVLELFPEGKPHLVKTIKNGMGLERRLSYKSSTHFALEDDEIGKPWATHLPFPVQVVHKVESIDHLRAHRVVSESRVRHGVFDPVEREFRGFGYVESRDVESFSHDADAPLSLPSGYEVLDGELTRPPAVTKTWFHTGVLSKQKALEKAYAQEYFDAQKYGGTQKARLPDTVLPTGLSGEVAREAVRALKGTTLRQEIYSEDGDNEKEAIPYQVSEQCAQLRLLQPKLAHAEARADFPAELRDGRARPCKYACFLVTQREALTFHYERDASDPRIAQQAAVEIDEYGTVLKSVSVVYPRQTFPAGLELDIKSQQQKLHATLSENKVLHVDPDKLVDGDSLEDVYRLALPVESQSFELHGLSVPASGLFSFDELKDKADEASFLFRHNTPDGTTQKRLLSWSRQYYRDESLAEDDFTLASRLPLGQAGPHALPHQSESAVVHPEHLGNVMDGRLGAGQAQALLTGDEGRLRLGQNEGDFGAEAAALLWVPTGLAQFDSTNFYRPVKGRDIFDNESTVSYDSLAIAAVSATGPLGNTVSADLNYRVLAPWQVTDPNGNRGRVSFDIFGRVKKMAVMGKSTENLGDSLDNPTTEFFYHLFEYQDEQKPNYVRTLTREEHVSDNASPRFQETFTYSDGAGNVLQEKVQAEPGDAPKLDTGGNLVVEHTNTRWVGTGRILLDNKGQPVKQYEPFFSHTSDYEDEAELVHWGVSPLMHYDPLGRLFQTDAPDGTFSKTNWDAWSQTIYDANDTVMDSQWFVDRQAMSGSADLDEKEKYNASEKAKAHHDTPSVIHLDSLGRAFFSIADAGTIPADMTDGGQKMEVKTKTTFDIEGNVLKVEAFRKNRPLDGGAITETWLTAEENTYAMGGLLLKTSSPDSGERFALLNAAGNPIRSYSDAGRALTTRFTYDALHRPIDVWVMDENSSAESLRSRTIYGEQLSSPNTTNHRGRVYRMYDSGGVATTESFDFKGNALSQTRQLVDDPQGTPDWNVFPANASINDMATAAASLLDSEVFESTSEYDGLNRMTKGRSGTRGGSNHHEVEYSFNDAALLESVTLTEVAGQAANSPIITNIDYNERGQRKKVVYGDAANGNFSGATTTYHYEPDTFRLRVMSTRKSADESAGTEDQNLQGLHYTYDPVGNITHIRDTAQQDHYFAGVHVSADQDFTYDALYRLIEASGREHAANNDAQPGGGTGAGGSNTYSPMPVGPQPGDATALRRYRQLYRFDEVGNLLSMKHEAGGGTPYSNVWQRHYNYAASSNRLLHTTAIGDDSSAAPNTWSHSYTYDTHGNMLTMPHPSALAWDDADQMSQATAGTQTLHFQYAGGQRIRKFVVHSGNESEERIYLGAFELYRKRNSQDRSGTTTLERLSFTVSDDFGRLCQVDTKTIDNGSNGDNSPANTPQYRYQLTNHLGSAAVEINEKAEVISYEEYHPFGTSSHRAQRSDVSYAAKRYRYAGKERDEETGLDYCGARYYASWLGRWTAADPIGIGDGVNVWAYVRGNPVNGSDPTGTETKPVKPNPADFDTKEYGGQYDNATDAANAFYKAQNEYDAAVEQEAGGSDIGHGAGSGSGTGAGQGAKPGKGKKGRSGNGSADSRGTGGGGTQAEAKKTNAGTGSPDGKADGTASETKPGTGSGEKGTGTGSGKEPKGTILDAITQAIGIIVDQDPGSEQGKTGGLPGGGDNSAEGSPIAQIIYNIYSVGSEALIGAIVRLGKFGKKAAEGLGDSIGDALSVGKHTDDIPGTSGPNSGGFDSPGGPGGEVKPVELEAPPAPSNSLSDIDDFVDLTEHRRDHILNRHRAGAGKPGKTEFPASWSDDRILHNVSDVATDPNAVRGVGKWNSPYVIGERDGVRIRVDFYPDNHPRFAGKISTAYPLP